MKVIKKIKIDSDITNINVPEFAPILNVKAENGEIFVFVLWENSIQETETITIRCYDTNEKLDTNYGKYLGTVLAYSGFVHVFENR